MDELCNVTISYFKVNLKFTTVTKLINKTFVRTIIAKRIIRKTLAKSNRSAPATRVVVVSRWLENLIQENETLN